MTDELSFWKIANSQDYQNAIGTKEDLHRNSRELLKCIKKSDILNDNMSVFEIGMGAGRNLYYLYRFNNTLKISGNDLVRSECFKYMDASIKDVVEFYEKDTLSLFQEEDIHPDILLSSDHLMHLPPPAVQQILELINHKWMPKFIVLRETKVSRERLPKVYRHDFSSLWTKYKIKYTRSSKARSFYLLVAERI